MCIIFAIHIIIQDRFNKDRIINFFVIQSLVASILSLLGSLIVEDISKIVFSSEAISAILITGILELLLLSCYDLGSKNIICK